MNTDTITTEAQVNIDEKIEKIGKLLAQARSAAEVGNTAEADSFTKMAFKLMARYDIDAAQVTNTTGEVKDELIVWDYEIDGEFAMDKTDLFFNVTNGVGSRALRYRILVPYTKQTYTYRMRVWGFQSQAKRIKFLFEALVPQMMVGSAAAAAPVTWEPKKNFRKTWMGGFGEAVQSRLFQARREAVREANEEQPGSGTSAELVLADKQAKAKSFFDEATTRTLKNGKKVKKYKTQRRSLSGSGRNSGYRAGMSASFGDNTIGAGRRALEN